MYEFSDFLNLIVVLAGIAVIYILFRWMQGRRKGEEEEGSE